VAAAVESIAHEFARIGAEGVDAVELSDSQAYLTGVLPLTLETNEGVAGTLLSMEWFGLGLDYLLRYRELIDGVTAADVQRVCAKYLAPEQCIIVVAGDINELPQTG
jgi:zinc protease